MEMARLVCGITAALLVASLAATSSFADQEQCVPDDQTAWAATVMDTRTIAPAVVVNPFAEAAAQSAPSDEDVVPMARPDPQRLPPGPPNRYP
jgi:hypothetical protein